MNDASYHLILLLSNKKISSILIPRNSVLMQNDSLIVCEESESVTNEIFF